MASNPVHYIQQLVCCSQLIRDKTRVTTTTASTLDVILSTIPDKHVNTGVIKCGLIDHYFTYTVLAATASNECSKDIHVTFRNYSKFDAKQYIPDLDIALRECNIDWVYDDVERTWSEFRNIFLQISDRHLLLMANGRLSARAVMDSHTVLSIMQLLNPPAGMSVSFLNKSM